MKKYIFISLLLITNRARTMESQALSQEVLKAQLHINLKLLSVCLEADQPQLILDLLEQGADIEAKDVPLGRTPLIISAYRKHPHSVQALLNAGANVHAKSGGFYPETALHHALHWNPEREHSNLPILDMLLKASADIEATGKHGKTPLLTALSCPRDGDDSYIILNRLLAAKPNLFVTDGRGNTALHIAAHRNRLAAVQLLLEKGLSIDAKNNAGSTALHKAKNARIITFLIKAGANSNATDQYGRTPIEKAYATYNEIRIPWLREDLGLAENIKALETAIAE